MKGWASKIIFGQPFDDQFFVLSREVRFVVLEAINEGVEIIMGEVISRSPFNRFIVNVLHYSMEMLIFVERTFCQMDQGGFNQD